MSSIAHHPSPWDLAAGHTLTELLEVSTHSTSGGCQWRRGQCAPTERERLDAAAWLVAEEIVRLRCGRAQHIFSTWRAAATSQRIADGADPSLATAFIESTFGLPPNGASEDHAQGYVAKIVWRMLTAEEQAERRSVAHLALPDPDVTSPGGDGFVIYRNQARADLASVSGRSRSATARARSRPPSTPRTSSSTSTPSATLPRLLARPRHQGLTRTSSICSWISYLHGSAPIRVPGRESRSPRTRRASHGARSRRCTSTSPHSSRPEASKAASLVWVHCATSRYTSGRCCGSGSPPRRANARSRRTPTYPVAR